MTTLIGIRRNGEKGILINDPSGKVNVVKVLGLSFPPNEGEPWPMAFATVGGGYQTLFNCSSPAYREELLKRVGFPPEKEGEEFFDYNAPT